MTGASQKLLTNALQLKEKANTITQKSAPVLIDISTMASQESVSIWDSFEESIGIFYDAKQNLFIDEDGFVIYQLFDIISPTDLYLFKLYKTDMVVPHQTIPELLVEMYYPDDEE